MRMFLNDEAVLEAGRKAGLTDDHTRKIRNMFAKFTPDGLAYLDEEFLNVIHFAQSS